MGKRGKDRPGYVPPTIIELGENIGQADALAAACTSGSSASGTGGCYAGSAARRMLSWFRGYRRRMRSRLSRSSIGFILFQKVLYLLCMLGENGQASG